MHAVFTDLLAELEPGEPIANGAWTFVPLSIAKKTQLEYTTLFEAVDAGLATVTEVNSEGSVAEVKVANQAPLPLFIPDGMTLVGCKQNRVVNISMVIPPQSEWRIPVSCVERLRWRPNSEKAAPSVVCDPGLRSAMCDQTTDSLLDCDSPRTDQGAVWQHVDKVLGSFGATSSTAAYHAAYDAAEPPGHITCPEGANGIAVLREGRVYSLDIFDNPATLNKLWPRIMRGTLSTATSREPATLLADDVRQFLTECFASPQGEFTPLGLGTHHRFRGRRSVASGLVVDDQLLHLCAFCKNGQAPTTTTHQPARPDRPWWRLWR